MGKKSRSTTTKKAIQKDRWTQPTFVDKTSGDTLCDFLYPHTFAYSMTALEILVKKVEIEDSEGTKSSVLDLVNEYKLVELDMKKDEFDAWAAMHTKEALESILHHRIGAFKKGSSELTKFISENFDKFKVFSGSSQNKEGSLAFAYEKDPDKGELTFIFYFDGLREGSQKYDMKMLEAKIKGTEITSAEKLKLIEERQMSGKMTLLSVVITHLQGQINEPNAKVWLDFLSDITKKYSDLPGFITTFFDKSRVEQILKLLETLKQEEGQPSAQETVQEYESNIFTACQTLIKEEWSTKQAQLPLIYGDSFIKTCIERGLFENYINNLEQLANEFKRTNVGVQEQDDSDESEDELQVLTAEDILKERQRIAKIVKKGVGYNWASEQNIYGDEVVPGMDSNQYLQTKEKKNQQIIRILKTLTALIKACQDESANYDDAQVLSSKEEKKIKLFFLESTLLPILEAGMRAGTILEMAKDLELYLTYFDMIEVMASKQTFFDLLSDIGANYEPRQKESLQLLLKNASEQAQVFLDCIEPDEPLLEKSKSVQEEQKKQANNPQKIAERLVEINDFVEMKFEGKLQKIASLDPFAFQKLPLKDAFPELLGKLKVKRINMRTDGDPKKPYKNHWRDREAGSNPRPTKLIRLAQEIADMSNSLPCTPENSIFIAVDTKRADYWKAVIFGAEGTPYAHGAFQYDIFFPDSYPNDPPKVNLMTTGGGSIRFNPNLYNCGYVCLSLLGTWGHDWDGKVSTMIQVLISIQAIVMSNEIYFNEPGWTNQMGTEYGENMNNGYKNLVRYANLKYCIVDQLRNPSFGFEDVIRRNFYLKKDMILKDVDEWIHLAKTEPATYCHQNTFDSQLQPKGAYLKFMEDLKKELIEEFAKLDSPYADISQKSITKEEEKTSEETKETVLAQEESKEIVQTQTVKINTPAEDQAEIDKVDVNFDIKEEEEESKEVVVNEVIDIEDEKVKDRWSRYIGTMGIEAVAKQAEATIFLSGLGGLGVEIAKNLVLAGCKELILHDTKVPTDYDLTSQFYIQKSDVDAAKNGKTKTRAQICRQKLQQLNSYVKVSIVATDALNDAEFFSKNAMNINVAIFTETLGQSFTNQKLTGWNDQCRANSISMVIADQNGLFSRVLTDFGEKHVVVDPNGEEMADVMVYGVERVTIKTEEEGKQADKPALKIILQPNTRHDFQNGDSVVLSEIIGLQENGQDVVNGKTYKVLDVVNTNEFIIECDATNLSDYDRNGMAKGVKAKVEVEFQPLKTILEDLSGQTIDGNFMDFEKLQNFKNTSLCYKVYGEEHKFDQLKKKELEELKKMSDDEWQKLQTLRDGFEKTKQVSFGPLCAFIGGVVAQEVVKAITKKYMPIRQEFYYDCLELKDFSQPNPYHYYHGQNTQDRYLGLRQIIGKSLVDAVRRARVFMVGAGAIGCELLKNFAMLGLGSDGPGRITMTDPDVIELSNLNRQFLFREKHIRKPKSVTAAASAIQMNPDLKEHITARLDKIHKDTEHIYNGEFYSEQTLVANALDNVKARVFIDSQCVKARVPLLDSGTLGPKGHVQVVLPFKTMSYASIEDPEDNNAIPFCTMKMFPETTIHCVEWSKALFETQFTLNAQNFNKLKESKLQSVEFNNMSERKGIKKAIKQAERMPSDFDGCIVMARNKFQKLYHNDSLQLLHVYPLDFTDPSGRPFWSLPKRPPKDMKFDPDDVIHRNFIAAFACLKAQMYGIKIPFEAPRSEAAKKEMARIASEVKVKNFVPDDTKAEEIKKQQETEETEEITKLNNEGDENEEELPMMEPVLLKKKSSISPDMLEAVFAKTVQDDKVPLFSVEEFEKDNDNNFHIDFIHAAGNARAMCYGLGEMDWITVKLKAGRIVPALATTTAAVAALQTIELLKIIKRGNDFGKADEKFKLEYFRDANLNLAVPSLMMMEPGPPVKRKLKEDLFVDEWERWEVEVTEKTKLGTICKALEKQFQLQTRDVILEATPIFLYALREMDVPRHQQPIMRQSLLQTIGETDGEALSKALKNGFVDLTVTFADAEEEEEDVKQIEQQESKILENVPTVRVIFKLTGN